jgi:fructose-bisphosphate aldolase class I
MLDAAGRQADGGGIAVNEEQLEEMGSGRGFIAALDQSGGSTPKALALYGIPEQSYGNEGQMFDLMHQARARLIESPSFTGDKILATILFEQTMDRTIGGEDAVDFLWKQKHIVPFVKVDQGLADARYGVQLMKPMTKLQNVLERAVEKGVFGTKMRSFIQEPNDGGIKAIIEPEVSIKSPDKPTADRLLVTALQAKLDELPEDRQVMIKLTLPDEDGLYTPLIEHPRVLRVVALSGGYSLDQSADILARNHLLIASFSRALTEGLTVDQSDAEFDQKLKSNIDEIYAASVT